MNHELSNQREDKARDQQEIDRLRDINCLKERENAEAAQRIKATDYSLYQAQEKAADMHKVAEARDYDLRRTTEAYDASACDLHRGRDEQAKL